jgi:peptidoglycan/LPS O-acetylase OafA/YrhL
VGIVRLFLALLVVVNHIWAPADNKLGYQAVVSFYIASGYLMTKVLHEVYGTDVAGTLRFLLNRALRIFPAYWFFLGLTVALLTVLPPEFSWAGMVVLPTRSIDWIANITLIDLTWAEGILVPPAWSLGIEVLFYILIPLVLARSRRAIEIWALASLAVTVALLVGGFDFGYRYYPAYAASLFFAVGALCHVHQATLARFRMPRALIWPAVAMAAVMPFACESVGLSHLTWAYYAGAALFAWILITLEAAPRPVGRAGKFDRFAGDLAYPVFLGHFIAAGLTQLALGDAVMPGSTPFLLVSVVVTLIIAVAFAVLVDPAIQRIRTRVRSAELIRPAPARSIDDPTTVPVTR